jgi:hypothetical protein
VLAQGDGINRPFPIPLEWIGTIFHCDCEAEIHRRRTAEPRSREFYSEVITYDEIKAAHPESPVAGSMSDFTPTMARLAAGRLVGRYSPFLSSSRTTSIKLLLPVQIFSISFHA